MSIQFPAAFKHRKTAAHQNDFFLLCQFNGVPEWLLTSYETDRLYPGRARCVDDLQAGQPCEKYAAGFCLGEDIAHQIRPAPHLDITIFLSLSEDFCTEYLYNLLNLHDAVRALTTGLDTRKFLRTG